MIRKEFEKKSLTNLFVSRQEGQLKGRTIIVGFSVWKLLVILSLTNFIRIT